jgi:hypothetical protein
MELRSAIQITVILVYLILIAWFYRIETYEVDCDDNDGDTVCVSFCANEKELPDSVIREHFLANNTVLDLYDDYKIIRGKPMCMLTRVIEPQVYKGDDDDEYTFDEAFLYFTPHYYCKQQKVDERGVIKWETLVCDNNQTLRLIFHGFGEILKRFSLSLSLS